MSAPQGLIEFAGIENPVSGQFTLAHGITPSSATIVCAPQPSMVWKVGPLVVKYGGVNLTFPDCTVDRISVEYAEDGTEEWVVHVLDRRWKWKQCGRISGYYNVRRGSDEIVKGTEKNPRQLAKLCLEAMGEKKYDVSALPTLPRPEIEWDYTLPAEALAKLCDLCGCHVTLQLDNSVRIVKVGEGNQLAVDDTATAGSVEPDPPERPDKLVFVAAKTRWQMDLILEPVGLDLEGDKDNDPVVKPLHRLSYTPQIKGRRTWDYIDLPMFNDIRHRKYRELAKKSVFRWYRIVPGFSLPGLKGTIDDLDRILPIEDIQIEKQKVDSRVEPRPAWIHGLFWLGLDTDDDADDESSSPHGDIKNKPKALFNGDFELDTERGIVMFAEPIYRFRSANPADVRIQPADLRLRTTISCRDPETRGWIRWNLERKLGGPKAKTLPRYITRDDVAHEYFYIYTRGNRRLFGNTTDLEKQANYYLDAAEREYQFTAPASVTYAGFRAINVDGAIQQVTWVSSDGFATTRASRNKEELLIMPTYKERRRMEQLREALQKERETERQRDEKRRKGRA